MSCIECGSSNLAKKGTYKTVSATKYRYKCNDCGKAFSVSDEIIEDKNVEISVVTETPKRLIITSANNGSDFNMDFFDCLLSYANINKADLLIIPTRHKNIGLPFDPSFPEELEPYLLKENLHFPNQKLKILASLQISSVVENPLAGLDPISKGDSMIVGHPQLQMKTLPRVREAYPAIVTTTGTISTKNYLQSKAGTKADFNHSFSAAVVEFEDTFVHIRHLNFDGVGFNDLDTHYGTDGVRKETIEAIVTGDEHAVFADPTVKNVTYDAVDSLVNILKPKMIVRHDVFDAYSISHHHAKNFLTRYKKFGNGLHRVEDELEKTIDYINDTTPSYATSYIIQSNHNEHLTRWLNECDPKLEPWNAKVYHKLMYEMLDNIDSKNNVDAFELYAKDKLSSNVKFVDRNEGLTVHGIMLESHGDVGSNGSRGSRAQFSLLPTRTIIGHSHSPGIQKGCYQIGTSSVMRLEYNVGASSWHHAHCIIHKNGKRQMVFITNGKYRN